MLSAVILGLWLLQNRAVAIEFVSNLFRRWEWFVLLASLSLSVWQRVLVPGHYENPPGVAPFSFGHFCEHLKIFFVSFSDWGLPYNFILLGLGVLSVGLVFTRHRSLLWMTVPVCVQLIIAFSHHAGQFDHPTQIRFFIPLALGSSLWVALLLREFGIGSSRLRFVFAVLSVLVFLPTAVSDRFLNKLIINRDVQWMNAFVQKYDPKRILIIYERPVQFTALGYGSLDLPTAHKEFDSLQTDLTHGLYDHILLFEGAELGHENKMMAIESGKFREVDHFLQNDRMVVHAFEMNSASK